MSDNDAPKMFGGTDVADGFFSALAGSLEDRMSADDAGGCLEIIKFVRRYVQDLPVTDYRTVGLPEAIKSFLDACGLSSGTDYTVEASSLDSSSHVVSFANTERASAVLGYIAGLRVTRGPSVCDRLYCEMCKDDGRDFRKALCAVSSDGNVPFMGYLLGRSAAVYSELADALAKLEDGGKALSQTSDADAEYVKAMAFAAGQVSGGKLLPTAAPVVPVAVAEAYLRLSCEKSGGKAPTCLFRVGEKPAEWIAARPVCHDESVTLPHEPPQVLRTVFPRFHAYMPDDAGAFDAAGCAGEDAAFVVAASQLRFPGKDVDDTVAVFSAAEDRGGLLSHVEKCYSACYPFLSAWFSHSSNVAASVGGKFVESAGGDGKIAALAKESDAMLGIGTDGSGAGYALVMSCTMILSPYRYTGTAASIRTTPGPHVSVHVGEKDDKKRKASDMNAARLWFRAVHNVAAPEMTEDEASSKMEAFLTESCAKTEAGNVPMAFAIALRSVIERAKERMPDFRAETTGKNHPGADASGLHATSRCVPQVVTTVTAPSSKSMLQFVRDAQAGKCVSAPAFPGAEYMFPRISHDIVTQFVKIADTSGVQLRAPRKVSEFEIYADTNIRFSLLYRIYDYVPGVGLTLSSRLAAELVSALAGDVVSEAGISRHEEKIRKAFGAKSDMFLLYKALVRNDLAVVAHRFTVCVLGDADDRAVVAVRIKQDMAYLLMLARASDAEADIILSSAVRNDPQIVFVSKDSWREELCDHLLGTPLHGHAALGARNYLWRLSPLDNASCELTDDDMLSSDMPVESVLSTSTVAHEAFAYLRGDQSSSLDPN